MKDPDLKRISEAARAFREVIEQTTGGDGFVTWSVMSKDGESASGFNIGKELACCEVEHMCFNLLIKIGNMFTDDEE